MATVIRSLGLSGISGYPLKVEAAIIAGLQSTTIVGLGDSAVKEATDRMEACTQELGYAYPVKKVVINHTSTWQPVKVYADEGFSGVLAEKRLGFMAMMVDARGNLIDIILVKSISRFARNAKEAQRYVHELKNLGVEVRFEREGISSMDGSAEMAFSMLAVAAQEESRSISENMKWSLRKHVEQGIRHLGSSRILGYNELNGVLVPNQDAWIVRVIFKDYAAGLYPIEIHRHLMDLGAANSTTKQIPGAGNMRKVYRTRCMWETG